ncbi:MAG: hypothetical protein GX437_05370 [Sphingobacteriales bacterium]|nr:hypothetical protein [Sphingobacteriales bacterium]
MRNLFLILLLTSAYIFPSRSQTFKDSRDQQVYKTVEIGNQVWMAENLKYKMTGSFCFDKVQAYCDTFGYLYTYKAATKACPAGWHLPSKAEFMELINYLGGMEKAGASLIKGGKSGFDALLGGDYTSDNDFFYGIGRHTSFWSSTIANAEDAFTMEIHEEDYSLAVYQNLFENGYYVRCLKNK